MIKGKLRIAFDELLREKNSGGNILLEAIALLLIGVIIFFQALNNYNENEIDKILKYGVKGTGEVEINSFDSLEELQQFEEEIQNVNGIDRVGSYIIGSVSKEEFQGDFFDKMYELQKGHQDIFWEWDESELGAVVEAVTVTVGSENIFDLQVAKGYDFDECENLLDEYAEVIYLGNEIKELEIGTELYNTRNQKVLIAGYLEPDLRIVKDEMSDESVAYTELDYKLLRVKKDEFANRGTIIFGISKNSDMNEVKEELYQLAQDCHVDMMIKTYEGIFDGIASEKGVLIDFLERILFVVLVTVVILQICMQSVHIIENFKNYGILYANGFSASDQFFIFAIQSISKGIIALFLTLGGGYLLIDLFYTDMIYSVDVLYDVILKYVWWKVGICAAVIAIFSTIVSILVFSRKTPKELILEG